MDGMRRISNRDFANRDFAVTVNRHRTAGTTTYMLTATAQIASTEE